MQNIELLMRKVMDGTGNDKLNFRPVDHHFELTKISGKVLFSCAIV